MIYFYPALQASFHSDLHSPLVDQILYHTGQPRNIYLWSEPANYYWLYHALVATFDQLLPLPDTQVWPLINIIALVSTFGWVYRSLAYVLPHRRHPFIEAMLAVFIVFSINLAGVLHAMVGILDGLPDLSQVLYLLLPEAFRDTLRLGSLFLKYPNYNSFPLSVMYTWMSIYLALKVLHNDQKPFDVLLFCSAFAGSTAYLLIGGFFTVATLLTAAIGTFLIHVLRTKQQFFKLPIYGLKYLIRPYLRLWLLCCLLFIAPVIHYAIFTLGIMAESTSDRSIQFIVRNFDALLAFTGAYYPLAPFILSAIYIVYIRRDKILLFLLMLGLAHMLPAYFFNFTHGNEYKFVLLGVFPLALVTVRMVPFFALNLPVVQAATDTTRSEQKTISLKTPLTIALYAFAVFNLIGVTAFFYKMGTTHQAPYIIEHDTFARATPFQLADAFSWIREETPTDTLIILLPPDTAPIAPRDTNRAWLVGDAIYSFTGAITEHNTMLEALEVLSKGQLPPSQVQEILQTLVSLSENHPVAIVLTDETPLFNSDLSIFADFVLAYSDKSAKVYYSASES
jgi:hypothetical protein